MHVSCIITETDRFHSKPSNRHWSFNMFKTTEVGKSFQTTFPLFAGWQWVYTWCIWRGAKENQHRDGADHPSSGAVSGRAHDGTGRQYCQLSHVIVKTVSIEIYGYIRLHVVSFSRIQSVKHTNILHIACRHGGLADTNDIRIIDVINHASVHLKTAWLFAFCIGIRI